MSDSKSNYTAIRPFRNLPLFMRQGQEIAEETGSVSTTVAELFRRARISVNVVGDDTRWREGGNGTLLAGDHRGRIEFAPLLATLGVSGRDDIHMVAKPFSTNMRLLSALGRCADDLPMPVIPRTLARDRRDMWNRDLGWRLKLRNKLPTRREIVASNITVIERAAQMISEGHLVNIYPAGGIMDACKHPWQVGVSKIIHLLSMEALHTSTITMFRFDDFSTTRILTSLILQSHGITPRPYNITLRVGPSATPVELFDDVKNIRRLDDAAIRDRLQSLFVSYFSAL